VTAYPAGIRRSKDLLGVTATTLLMLCIWLGPDRACLFIAIAAVLTIWVLACRRWPLVLVFRMGILRGLLRR
jgi:hypothetical protein